jgi:hypothetical protein
VTDAGTHRDGCSASAGMLEFGGRSAAGTER